MSGTTTSPLLQALLYGGGYDTGAPTPPQQHQNIFSTLQPQGTMQQWQTPNIFGYGQMGAGTPNAAQAGARTGGTPNTVAMPGNIAGGY